MLDPKRIQRHLRNLIYLLTLLGAFYIYWRFSLVRLPRSGCSPLLRVAPGDLLLFDLGAERYEPGDVVLFRGPDGRLHLGEVRPPGEGLGENVLGPRGHWIRTDRPDCPGLDSLELGWIDRGDLHGRMLLASGQF